MANFLALSSHLLRLFHTKRLPVLSVLSFDFTDNSIPVVTFYSNKIDWMMGITVGINVNVIFFWAYFNWKMYKKNNYRDHLSSKNVWRGSQPIGANQRFGNKTSLVQTDLHLLCSLLTLVKYAYEHLLFIDKQFGVCLVSQIFFYWLNMKQTQLMSASQFLLWVR